MSPRLRAALGFAAVGLTAAGVIGWARPAWAAMHGVQGLLGKENVSDRPIFMMASMAGMSLLPLVIIMVTSFVKLTVVLNILRQALGTKEIPPTMVLTGLAVIMTFYIMAPTMLDGWHHAEDALLAKGITLNNYTVKKMEPVLIEEMSGIVQQPIREFLAKHAEVAERHFFYDMARKMRTGIDRDAVTEADFQVLTPAFTMTELKEAFVIALILYVPLIAIDLVCGNILMALGMQMLSPTTVSMPFKILLFVVVDGWHLLFKGLCLGYT